MPVDYGIKVSVTGEDISSVDIRDLLMSSSYSMLKYHSDNTDSVTVSGGDTDKYVDFTHSLGYVPAFIAYQQYGGNIYFIPSVPRSGGFDNYSYAYADTTKIRCGIVFPDGYNTITRTTFDSCNRTYLGNNDPWVMAGVYAGGGELLGGCVYDDIGSGISDTVTIPQGATISSALLDFHLSEKGAGGNPSIKTYGIDVDDVSPFGTDMGQAQTTAVTNQSVAAPQGENFGITVTSQVQEIVNRAGWANGNNLGFYIFNNGSSDNQYVSTYGDNLIELTLVKSGSTTVDFRCVIFKDKIT